MTDTDGNGRRPRMSADRVGPTVAVAPALVAMGALSGRMAGADAAALLGGAAGLAWAVLVGALAARVRRGGGRSAADWSVLSAVVAAAGLFGGSLFAMLLYSAARPTPETVFVLIRPPLRGGLPFFAAFNTLMEWLLLPAALSLNWHVSGRRTPIAVGAALFYLGRAWTYLYFVPAVFDFMALPPGDGVPDVLAERAARWIELSWFRTAIDGLLVALLMRASSRSDTVRESRGMVVAAGRPVAVVPLMQGGVVQ